MKNIFFAAAFVTCLFHCSNVGLGQEVHSELKNGDFEETATDGVPDGWSFSGDDSRISSPVKNSESGARCFRFENRHPTRFSNLSQSVEAKAYLGKRIRLQAAIRTEVSGANNQAQLMLGISRNDGSENSSNFFYNMYDRPITNPGWKVFNIVADVPGDSGKIHVGCFLNGVGVVCIDDVRLEAVDKSVALTVIDGSAADQKLMESKPGIYYLTGSRYVEFRDEQVDTATLSYPLPLAYRDQVPVSYELVSTPASAIDSTTIKRDKLNNYIATVVVKRVEGRNRIKLDFKSSVLVGPSKFKLPKKSTEIPDVWPEEARPWLAASWCANADHRRIAEIGKHIRSKTNDVLEIIDEVIAWRKKIELEASGTARNCTAIATLDGLGSCTNNANLVAALLRASGVPARILSGFPSWSGPLETHYIVEAWLPEHGWYPIESTKGLAPWPNSGQIIVSIVPIEYESESLASARTSASSGVPFRSLTEYASQGIRSGGLIEGGRHFCPHECKFGKLVTATEKEWKAALSSARKNWNNWLNDPKINSGRLSAPLFREPNPARHRRD